MASDPGDEIQRLVVSIVGNHLPYLGALAVSQAATVKFAKYVDKNIGQGAAASVYLFGTVAAGTAAAVATAWQQMSGAIEETVQKAADLRTTVERITILGHAAEVAGISITAMKIRMMRGTASFKEAAKEAKRLGLIFTNLEGQRVRRAREEIRRLGQALKGLGTQIVIATAPSLRVLAKVFTNLISIVTWFASTFRGLTAIVIGSLTTLAVLASAVFLIAGAMWLAEKACWAFGAAVVGLRMAIWGLNAAMAVLARNPLIGILMLLAAIPLALGGNWLLQKMMGNGAAPADGGSSPQSDPYGGPSSDPYRNTSMPMRDGSELASLFRQNLSVSQQMLGALQTDDAALVHIA